MGPVLRFNSLTARDVLLTASLTSRDGPTCQLTLHSAGIGTTQGHLNTLQVFVLVLDAGEDVRPLHSSASKCARMALLQKEVNRTVSFGVNQKASCEAPFLNASFVTNG